MKRKSKGRRPEGKGRNYKDSNLKRDRQTREVVDTVEAEKRDSNNRDAWQSPHNDWRWYATNDQLIADYASFPYGVPLGTPTNALTYTIAGVMGIYFSPCVGTQDGEASAINIAARRMYSWVRHANSGHANYESPDLMMYMMAMDSCYMYLAYLQRLYGTMSYFLPTNRYVPKALVDAMGIDYDDILANYNDLRGYINLFALRLSSMCIPNSMPYMARHSWMCSGLYMDGSTTKAQIYLYVPTSFYQYTNAGSGGVGSLNRTFLFTPGVTNSYNKFKDLVKFGDQILNPIITTEALNIMSGDILKAYGIGGIVTPTTIPDNYITIPAYNQEVLSQIENATLLGQTKGGISQNTSVGGGYLVSNEYFEREFMPNTTLDAAVYNNALIGIVTVLTDASRVVNMHHENVTPAETMVATRLTNVYTATGPGFGTKSGTLTLQSDTVGSEAAECAVMYTMNTDGTFTLLKLHTINAVGMSISDGTIDTQNNLINAVNFCLLPNAFDWAPSFTVGSYYYDAPTEGAVSARASKVFSTDYDNYTVLTPENLRNLSRTALLSEFWVPNVG